MDTTPSSQQTIKLFWLTVFAFAPAAQADCVEPVRYCPPKPCCCRTTCHRLYLDTNVGRSYDYAHNNSVIFLANNSPPVYGQLNNFSSPNANYFSVGAGCVMDRPTDYFPYISTGLQYRYTVPVTVAASITDISQTEEFLVGLGSYKLGQQSYLVQAKADIYRWGAVMPYVSLGLGVSLNRISQFQITQTDIIINAPAKTQTAFAYSVGAGLDFPIKRFWATLGYSYDHFGKSKETIAPRDPEIAPININNKIAHAQSVVLGVRYLFA